MTRRGFFATLCAPVIARFLPKLAPKFVHKSFGVDISIPDSFFDDTPLMAYLRSKQSLPFSGGTFIQEPFYYNDFSVSVEGPSMRATTFPGEPIHNLSLISAGDGAN